MAAQARRRPSPNGGRSPSPIPPIGAEANGGTSVCRTTNATQMPSADFYATIQDGVEAAIKAVARARETRPSRLARESKRNFRRALREYLQRMLPPCCTDSLRQLSPECLPDHHSQTE